MKEEFIDSWLVGKSVSSDETVLEGETVGMTVALQSMVMKALFSSVLCVDLLLWSLREVVFRNEDHLEHLQPATIWFRPANGLLSLHHPYLFP